MNGQPSRSTWLRTMGVVAITATITLAAACSDQDAVDTVPPPWPTRTVTPDGPASVPGSTTGPAATSTPRKTPPTTTKPTRPTTTTVASSSLTGTVQP